MGGGGGWHPAVKSFAEPPRQERPPLFLLAAAVSPRINIPGIQLSHHSIVGSPEGD